MLRSSLGVSIGWVGISMVADGVPALLLPHRLLAEGRTDATTLGLVTLVAIGVAALLQPTAGRLSDRVGRFPLIGAGTVIAVAGLSLLAIPDRAGAGAILPVAATVIALAGVSIAQAGQQALLPDRIGADWRGRAGGLKGAFDVAGAFAGFLILAALLERGQAGPAAGALALGLIAGAGLTWVLVRPRPGGPSIDARDARPVPAPDVIARLARLVLARFLFLLGIYAVGRFLVLFLADRLDLAADAAGGQAGTVLATLAVVTVCASVPGGWLADRIGRRRVMLAGGGTGALGIGLMPAAGSLEAVLVFGALMAVGAATFGSASWAMLADLADSADAGRLMGYANLGTAGAAAAAGAFGILIDGGGFAAAFLLAAMCSTGGAALAWTTSEDGRPAVALVGNPEGAN